MIRRKQGGRRHHLTRLAVAALRDLFGGPRLLHGVAVVARQPLDRHDSPAGYSGDRRYAGSYGLSIHDDRTSPALRDAAAELCSRKPERIPQNPQQGSTRVVGCGLGFSVNDELYRHYSVKTSARIVASVISTDNAKHRAVSATCLITWIKNDERVRRKLGSQGIKALYVLTTTAADYCLASGSCKTKPRWLSVRHISGCLPTRQTRWPYDFCGRPPFRRRRGLIRPCID